MKRLPWLILVLGWWTAPSHAELYKWVDETGRWHYSDKKPRHVDAEALELNIKSHSDANHQRSVHGGEAEKPASNDRKVVMYSTAWCGYCKQARNYFRSKGIAFTEYDVERNPTARRKYQQLGASGVPVIFVGKRRMNGFSSARFERLYNQQ